MSQEVKLDVHRSLRQRVRALGQPYPREVGGLPDRAAARLKRSFDRRNLLAAGGFAALRALGPVRREGDGPRVLVLSLRAWPNHVAYEAVLAHALALRGADVHLLTCGGGQPACEMGWARRALPRPCDRCAFYTDDLVDALGVPAHRLADRLPWGGDARRAPLEPAAVAGRVDPVRASRISLPWFVRTSDPDAVADGPEARRDLAVAAAGVEHAVEAILDAARPEIVVMVNGLFGDEAVVREVAARRGIRTSTYELAPRGGALVFSNDVPAPAYDTDAAWEAYGDRPLAPDAAAAVEQLLAARAGGRGAHERFFDHAVDDAATLRRELDLPDGARVASLFTNLSWDSATLYHDVAYPSMMEWVEDAIRATGERDDTVLVVRVHPSEAKWGSRESAELEMRERFGGLPGHVRWIGPSRPLSSYALCDLSDLVLAYTTTVGLEAATRGARVAVAGDTHYRGRGFTIDLERPADLRAALAAGGRLDDDARERALRYAFVFFFRSMVPFGAVRVDGHVVTGVPASVEELRPGRDPHLDFVCERILDGGSFTLPDDLALADAATAGAAS
jgi:hypothetical protein